MRLLMLSVFGLCFIYFLTEKSYYFSTTNLAFNLYIIEII